ncbi:MAG: polyprenyl synthetase family protein [Lentisphaerae bacterium]|nr:polyprenyl synthetase family protein [Lentisphaerota bacterium]
MFDCDVYLKHQREWIDRELDRRLPAAENRPGVLHAAMRYALFTGGKRLRPILCLAAADAVAPTPNGQIREAALRAALACEVLHTYTLIHDDLPCMDDDAMRRGKPTVHVVYGEANAVLVGDALQALAFEWLAGAEESGSPVAGRLVAELAAAAGSRGVVGGQVEDIAAAGTAPTPETVAFIHRHKTGDLFRAAVRMGGLATGATEAALAALTRYGEAFGEAFQITDDLLDDPAVAPATPAGKSAKPPPLSCLSVMTRATAEDRARALIAVAVSSIAGFQPDARRPLEAIVRRIEDRKQ